MGHLFLDYLIHPGLRRRLGKEERTACVSLQKVLQQEPLVGLTACVPHCAHYKVTERLEPGQECLHSWKGTPGREGGHYPIGTDTRVCHEPMSQDVITTELR